MSWKSVCDLRFHEVLQTTIISQITKGNEESEKMKNAVKNSWNCVQIFICACQCVWRVLYTIPTVFDFIFLVKISETAIVFLIK